MKYRNVGEQTIGERDVLEDARGDIFLLEQRFKCERDFKLCVSVLGNLPTF